MDNELTMRMLKTLPHLMYKMFHDIKELEIPDQSVKSHLNKTQRKTLLILYSEEKINMSKFCRILNVEKGFFTSVIDSLLELGLVERLRDNQDRRKVHIYLTLQGRKLVKKGIETMSAQIDYKLSSLSNEDYKRFIKAINDLSEITKKL